MESAISGKQLLNRRRLFGVALMMVASLPMIIPLVAHPETYPAIEHGVTGMHARTSGEVEQALLELVDD